MGRSWSLIVVALLAGACGSRTELGDGSENVAPAPGCDETSRCGGELFGRWRAVSACTDLGFVGSVLPCDGIRVRQQAPVISGYKSYSTEGLYSSSLSYAGSVRMFVPDSCSDLRAGAATCVVLQGLLLRRGELLLSDVQCAASDGGCTCDATLLPFERESSGTFTTNEGRLNEESGDEGDYCVDGDVLRVETGASEQLVFVRD